MRTCLAVLLCIAGLAAQQLTPSWSTPLAAPPAGPPVAHPGGVVATLASGRIVFLDAAGRPAATAQLDRAALGPALVHDNAVYAADAWGAIYKFRLSGERVWKYERQTRAGSGYNTLVLAGGNLVLTDTRGHLYAVNPAGRLVFEINATTYRLSTPAAGDVDNDGTPDLLFGADDETVYCVSLSGRLLWSRKLEGGRFGRAVPAVADLDNDGALELYITTPFVGRKTGLYSLDARTGALRWHARSEMQTYASIVFLDVDNDGRRDILYGDKNTRLYAVNAAGRPLWNTQLGGRGIFYAPVAAAGAIYQITRDTSLDGKSLFTLDRAGRIQSATALDGGGAYSPAIAQWNGRPTLLTLSTKGVLQAFPLPAGQVEWASWRNSPASTGFFPATAPTRTAAPKPEPAPRDRRAAQLGTNRLPAPATFTLVHPDGSRHTTVNGSTYTIPAPGRYKFIDAADPRPVLLTALPPTLDLALPATPLGDAVAARLRAEHDFAAKHPSVERYDRLRANIVEARALFQSIAGRPPADVLVRPLANPWTQPAPAETLHARLLGNEYESLAFTVTNLRPEPAQIRVATAAPFVDLREVPLVRPESTGVPTEDVLPRLNEASLLHLLPGESRKLWAIVHSRDLKPGRHTATLQIGDTLSLNKPLDFPLTVDVSPARLPAKRAYQQCHWLYLASISDPALREATIVDALEHGMTVFPIPALSFPLSGPPDSKLHDEIVTRLKGRATFLVTGSVSGPLAQQNYAEAIRRYSAHMLSLGVGFDEWAFYYMDEPGLMGQDAAFDKYVADITRIKQADPRVRIYANPAGGARPEMLAPLTKLIDIWQPDLHLVRENPEAYRKVFEQGVYWHYEAGADQRHLDPTGYYRVKPWVAFQMGQTGGGYWVYSYSNFWFFDQNMATEYGTVYPSPRDPVTTKRWEASRDGAEDFELLWQLRLLARAKNDAPALKLIDEAVAFVTAGQESTSDISRQVSPIAPDFNRWMQFRRDLISAWEKLL